MSTTPARGAGGKAVTPGEPAASNFLRTIVEDDLRSGRYAGRTWSGRPRMTGPGAPAVAAGGEVGLDDVADEVGDVALAAGGRGLDRGGGHETRVKLLILRESGP